MTDPASDPNNPANWLAAGFQDGSSLTFGGAPALNPVPSLPPIGGTQTVSSQGGAPASGGTQVDPSIAAPIAPSNPARITVNPKTDPNGPATGSISDYFLRTIIVILGFIFVAVGLNMFRPGIVPDPRALAPKIRG